MTYPLVPYQFNFVLSFIFLFPLLGSVLTYVFTKRKENLAKSVALFFTVIAFLATLVAAFIYWQTSNIPIHYGFQVALVDRVSWISQIGVS